MKTHMFLFLMGGCCCSVLFQILCFGFTLFFYYHFLVPMCFLMKDKKGVDPDVSGGEEELGAVGGKRNHNQNVFYGKIFSQNSKLTLFLEFHIHRKYIYITHYKYSVL